MGGTVAHHMATALRRAGEPVGLVVLIDANSPERIIAVEGLDQARTEAETRLRYLRSVEAFLDLGWGPYCPRLRVAEVPAHHYSIIRSPQLAPLLSDALRLEG